MTFIREKSISLYLFWPSLFYFVIKLEKNLLSSWTCSLLDSGSARQLMSRCLAALMCTRPTPTSTKVLVNTINVVATQDTVATTINITINFQTKKKNTHKLTSRSQWEEMLPPKIEKGVSQTVAITLPTKMMKEFWRSRQSKLRYQT